LKGRVKSSTIVILSEAKNLWTIIARQFWHNDQSTPDAFALSAYYALFVVQLALQHPKPLKNFDRFKAAFIDEADHYRAITGLGTYNNGMLTVF
jgi:hypothetical protein